MGMPEYLSAATVDELKSISQLQSQPLPIEEKTGALSIEVSMSPQSVAAIHFSS
jgi:hypothetical protein